MTNEQINEAITEATGLWDYPYSNDTKRMYDFCADLNAMHDAEKVLTDNQFLRYSRWIESLMQSPEYRSYLSATAYQRAKAFLKTLGKWEEVQG